MTDDELPEFLGGPPEPRAALPARVPTPPADGRRFPGESGLWLLIAEDMTVFAILFGAFLVNRGRDAAHFAAGRDALVVPIGAVNTVVLLTSSLLVAAGVRAFRTGAAQRALAMLGAAGALGLVFVGLKAFEWGHALSAGHTPASSSFFMFYFALTGVHFLHVLIGLVVLVACRRRIRRDPDATEAVAFVEGGACFWHMVDALWIVLFALLYRVST